jgi:hypothetical protein
VPSRLWRGWKRIAHRAAEFQSRVILALLYWIVVVPVGLLRGRARRRTAAPEWKTRAVTGPVTIEDARRQF